MSPEHWARVRCESCYGQGWLWEAGECPSCDGRGWKESLFGTIYDCGRCNGTGEAIIGKVKCDNCGGSGKVIERVDDDPPYNPSPMMN
jgi:DnaJ-class molecular chaperone